jgi:hypothetical protein
MAAEELGEKDRKRVKEALNFLSPEQTGRVQVSRIGSPCISQREIRTSELIELTLRYCSSFPTTERISTAWA